MSSPNIGSVDLSTSPLSSANSAAARKRLTTGTPVYSPNETLNQMTQEAEARQQDKYTAQKEIRAIRAKEMEKQRKEDEEREREETSRVNRALSINSSSTSTSSQYTKPRVYSTSSSTNRHEETSTVDPDNPRELKKKLAEMEEKFKKHAMFQTQLENDNQKLIYEVDLLKDLIEEHQELIIELRRQFKEKSKELDYQKRSNKDLQTDFVRLKEILKQRDALIEESGLRLYTDYEVKKGNFTSKNSADTGGSDCVNEIKSVLPAVLLAPDTAKLLDLLGEGTIDDKLRKLFSEKQEIKEHNSRLLIEIEDERKKSTELDKKLISNANKLLDSQETSQELHDIQRQYTKEINDLKMKLQKIEHENIIIKQDKQRLDTQLKYLQTNFDELENTERRLIKEKRDAQREFRELKTKYQDSLLDNKRLQDRIDSLEFYAKTNTNSSVFHNLTPSSYNTSSSSSSSNGSSQRGRTPAPSATRQRLGSNSSSVTSSSSTNYSTTPSSYYDSSSSTYRSSSRPPSRQSSVERSYTSSYDTNNSLLNSSLYGSTHRLSDLSGSTSVRSRNSSPSRFDTTSSDRWGSSSATSNWAGSTRNLATLPPHPTYDTSTYSRSKREPSSDRVILRNRRETSQERSSIRPTTSSVLLKLRRSSFVDNSPSSSKYY